MNRKRNFLGIAITVLFAVVLAVFHFNGLGPKDKKTGLVLRPTYKETSYVDAKIGAGGLMVLKNPKYISEVISTSGIIVTGEIISIDSYKRVLELKEGTPEKAVADKQGNSGVSEIGGKNLTVRLSDIIKGAGLPENIAVYIPSVYEDLVPRLEENNVYVFFLNWNKELDGYIFAHPEASFFEVGKEDKIRAFYQETSDFYEQDGKTYEKFRSKLQAEIKVPEEK